MLLPLGILFVNISKIMLSSLILEAKGPENPSIRMFRVWRIALWLEKTFYEQQKTPDYLLELHTSHLGNWTLNLSFTLLLIPGETKSRKLWTGALQPLEVPIIHLAFFQLPWKLNILKDEGFFLTLLHRFSVTSAFNEIAAHACLALEPGRKSSISYSQSSPKAHYGLSGHLKWWERAQLILVLVCICPTFRQSHKPVGTLIPLTQNGTLACLWNIRTSRYEWWAYSRQQTELALRPGESILFASESSTCVKYQHIKPWKCEDLSIFTNCSR